MGANHTEIFLHLLGGLLSFLKTFFSVVAIIRQRVAICKKNSVFSWTSLEQ